MPNLGVEERLVRYLFWEKQVFGTFFEGWRNMCFRPILGVEETCVRDLFSFWGLTKHLLGTYFRGWRNMCLGPILGVEEILVRDLFWGLKKHMFGTYFEGWGNMCSGPILRGEETLVRNLFWGVKQRLVSCVEAKLAQTPNSILTISQLPLQQPQMVTAPVTLHYHTIYLSLSMMQNHSTKAESSWAKDLRLFAHWCGWTGS